MQDIEHESIQGPQAHGPTAPSEMTPEYKIMASGRLQFDPIRTAHPALGGHTWTLWSLLFEDELAILPFSRFLFLLFLLFLASGQRACIKPTVVAYVYVC